MKNTLKRKRPSNNRNSKRRKPSNNNKTPINVGVEKANEFINQIESIRYNKKLNKNNLSDDEFHDLQNSIQEELIIFFRNNTFWKRNPSDLIQFIKTLEKHEKKINKSNRPNPLIEIYHPLSLVILFKVIYDKDYYDPDTDVINRIANYCNKDTGLYLKRYRQTGSIPRTYNLVYNMLSKLQEECVVGIGPWLLPSKLNKKVSL